MKHLFSHFMNQKQTNCAKSLSMKGLNVNDVGPPTTLHLTLVSFASDLIDSKTLIIYWIAADIGNTLT